MVDRPYAVDPLPSLQQLSLVVEPSQGTQSRAGQQQQVHSTGHQPSEQHQQSGHQHRQHQQAPYAQSNNQAATASTPAATASASGPAQAQGVSSRTSSGGSRRSGGGVSSDSNSRRLPDSPEGPDVIKVSSRSRVAAVAGKVAHDIRDGRLPRIVVAGNHSIATATKAVMQARRYLRPEGQDIAFSPVFRSPDHSRALLELVVVCMPVDRGTAADNLAMLDNAGGHETRIASSSRHARAGSAAARQLRTRGISVLCSVGQEALANSVMATAHAACFLADVGRQMVVQPIHVVLQRGDQELHSIKLVVTFA